MDGTTFKKRLAKLDGRAIRICTLTFAAVAAVCAFLLTFTVSDYFIFNRIGQYGFFFCLSQWIKKAGLILIVLAAFFGCRSCAGCVKYVLPLFVILSCCLFGDFFDAALPIAEGDVNGEIFNSVNLFFPKWLNITLFFLENAALLACCALFFLSDGVLVKAKVFITFPLALLLSFPLNLFENFFDITAIPKDSFLRFYNFTIWHFFALCFLVGSTLGLYYFLKNKPRAVQDKYLAAVAVALLLQYHSKDSMVLADGYNVYRTIFACLPLFICNAGVYVAAASVIFKRKVLYAMSFFIHAVGALTVFIYFGKNEMSNYGIFCSYSILYFCVTHCLLFALCVLPSAFGHYRFKIKDCIIPLVYYFAVIVVASVASTLVSSLSASWTTASGSHLVPDGVYVPPEGYLKPNYAFTQINPLPFEVPNLIPLGGVFKYINIFYVLLVYIAYVCLFFAFYGAYRAFLAIRKIALEKWLPRLSKKPVPNVAVVPDVALSETAAADASANEDDEEEETEKSSAEETGGKASAPAEEEAEANAAAPAEENSSPDQTENA